MSSFPLRAPPYLEFLNKGAHGAGLHIRDRDGRPLGERSAPASAQDGLVIEERISRYPGREGRSMNYSGYRQVMENLAPAMQALAAARRTYGVAFGVRDLSPAHLWRFSRIVSSLPSFLVHRRERPVADGDLSVVVAALYKIGGGPFLTSARMLLDENGYRHQVSPTDYMRYTEEHGVFNIAGGACAAPPRLVLEFLGNAMHGFPEEVPSLAALVPEIEDEEAFHRYACLCLAQDYLKIYFALGCGALYADLLRSMADDGDSERALRAGVAATENFGWLFGIGRRIFDRNVMASADVRLLREHAALLRRAAEIVRVEMAEIVAVLASGSTSAQQALEGRIPTLADGREPAAELPALERSARVMLESLENEISASLGWSATNLPCETFALGSEVPRPRDVLGAALGPEPCA